MCGRPWPNWVLFSKKRKWSLPSLRGRVIPIRWINAWGGCESENIQDYFSCGSHFRGWDRLAEARLPYSDRSRQDCTAAYNYFFPYHFLMIRDWVVIVVCNVFVRLPLALERLYSGSPDKPRGLSIQPCKSEKEEPYICHSSQGRSECLYLRIEWFCEGICRPVGKEVQCLIVMLVQWAHPINIGD